jgi:cell division protein FtsB
MRKIQRKKKIIIVLLSLILFFLVFFSVKIYFKSRNALFKSEKIASTLEEARQRKIALEQNMACLESETCLEEEMRQRFNARKPGEQMLVIVDKTGENGKIEKGGLGGFFGGIWDWIRSKF